MKKKLISAIIISTLLVGTLAGCGGKTTTADSQEEVASAETINDRSESKSVTTEAGTENNDEQSEIDEDVIEKVQFYLDIDLNDGWTEKLVESDTEFTVPYLFYNTKGQTVLYVEDENGELITAETDRIQGSPEDNSEEKQIAAAIQYMIDKSIIKSEENAVYENQQKGNHRVMYNFGLSSGKKITIGVAAKNTHIVSIAKSK